MIPQILYDVKDYLCSINLKISTSSKDGRTNSCCDEDMLISLIKQQTRFENKIKIPKIRWWYDILLNDEKYGWIPVNIKTTTTNTSDNIGNLAPCVYSYTNYEMDFDKKYTNGFLCKIIINKLKTKQYNTNRKKDYYFLVINKNNPNEIIINSILGLENLTSNINNLPFQVKWKNNKVYIKKPIKDRIKEFILCLKRPIGWKEFFLMNIRYI